LETLPELAHITARLLLLVAEENVEPEELPFGQGTREFWELLSHASQIPDDDYWSVKIFQQLSAVLPLEVLRNWEYFTEVHGRLLVNSFEVSDDKEKLLGYALYLGPSILDHSCKPTAEVKFIGSRIEVTCKAVRSTTNLREITISYIDKNLGREERRSILRKHFHFDCLCQRCLNEEADPPAWLAELAVFKHSVAAALQARVKEDQRYLLSSLRCDGQCGGRPVGAESGHCSHCGQGVGRARLDEYRAVRNAVEAVLDAKKTPQNAAPDCMELMTGLIHPYNLTYVRCCQASVQSCLLQGNLKQALDWCDLLLGTARSLARNSEAHQELVEKAQLIENAISEKREE